MNNIWSKYVQGVKTLYYTRKLRFDDMFAGQYKALFDLDTRREIKILEVGCGPGALAGALKRWYPNGDVTALDRDSEFIYFARQHVHGVEFIEGDATALPFEDNTFDVTISNTVSEHIEPSHFYGEQRRVLKPGGICVVLSSRRGVNLPAACLAPNELERAFWEKANRHDDSMDRFGVCKYPMSEAELPQAMEKYGFYGIKTGFATIDLTPDNPKFTPELAHNIINASRYTALDAIDAALYTMPNFIGAQEASEMRAITNAKYDKRIYLYDQGEKQWDTCVSIIMAIRGIK